MEKELLKIRDIALSILPPCFHLENIDITFGSLYEGQTPNFKVIVQVIKVNKEIDEPEGWGYELTQKIRKFWSKDDLYVSINIEDKFVD